MAQLGILDLIKLILYNTDRDYDKIMSRIYLLFKCFGVRNNIPLERVSYGDTIPYIPPVSSGKVVKVYDGDTFTIATKLPHNKTQYYRFPVRIKGIDTPELRTKNQDEKKYAIIARDYLAGMINDKVVRLENVEFEKYGRLLADVYVGGVNVSKEMLAKRYAVEYDGKKKPIISWNEYVIPM